MTQPDITKKSLELIKKAQAASDKTNRAKAINELWEIYGEQITNTAFGKSYLMNSDFNLNAKTPEQRRKSLMNDAFFEFRESTLKYDTSSKVPFLAFINQHINWMLEENKRKNTKHSYRHIPLDNIQEINIFCAKQDSFEHARENNNAIRVIRNKISKEKPQWLHYFNAMVKTIQTENRYTDVDAAIKMHCTPANAGIFRKKLRQFLLQSGLKF